MPTPADQPETKAGYMKDYLTALRRLPAEKNRAVLQGLEDLVSEIENASRSAWLPISANLRVTNAVFRKLGSAEANEFYAQWIRRQIETPVWTNLIRGALALFGHDPGSLAQWMPAAFGLMYRNYGQWKVQRIADTHVQLELTEMPTELATNVYWQQSVRSGLFALYRLTRVDGEIVLEAGSNVHRTMVLTLRWHR